MKTWWIALLLLLTVSACLPGKIGKKDPEPDLAGTYQITYFASSTTTFIPKPGVSGSVNVVKSSDTQLSVSLTTNENGNVSTSTPFVVSISKSGGSVYDMIGNAGRIGTIDGTTFTLNTNTYSLTAKK